MEDPFDVVKDVQHVYEVKSKNASYSLYQRAYHVLHEAKRVHDFKATCEDESMNDDTKI